MSCFLWGQTQNKFTKNDYLLINYILHYNFDSKTFKPKTKNDSSIVKKFESVNMPKRVLKDFRVGKLVTARKLVKEQLMDCNAVGDFSNELKRYFKENKREYVFSIDTLNKYVKDYEISVGKEDPIILFDKPVWFNLNNKTFSLIGFYSLINRSNGQKSLYLVESKDEGEFDVVCEKVLLVH